MKLLKTLIYITIIFLIILAYNIYSPINSRQKAKVIKVIDGDTLDTDLGKIRLLGINAPEKDRYHYDDSKQFLIKLENKNITLVKLEENKDRYGRKLRYIFYNNENINKQLLEKGLAHLYYYQEDKFTDNLLQAEKQARDKQLGIWEKSEHKCGNCIKLKELNEIDPGEYLILGNDCNYNCNLTDWTIKDNANHIKELNLVLKSRQHYKIDYKGRVWNDNGDSLYLRDNSGKLALFYRY